MEGLQNVMIWLVAEEAVYDSAYMAKYSKKTDSGKVSHSINEEKVCSF